MYGLSERQACRIVGQPRGTQRYVPTLKPDKDELTRNIIELASEYGRYGTCRVAALLNESGIGVGKDRVQRIWRREGLKVPQKQPRRSRLWLNDGSCIRLRPQYRNHVWSFDFVECHTHDGRRLRLMTLIDGFTRKCLAIRVARRINAIGVIETLADAMLFEGTPVFIRSDNGPEMVAKVLRQWLSGLGTQSLYIEPGSPWENG
jgi:putative transposase